jgi:hypothetical protein
MIIINEDIKRSIAVNSFTTMVRYWIKCHEELHNPNNCSFSNKKRKETLVCQFPKTLLQLTAFEPVFFPFSWMPDKSR